MQITPQASVLAAMATLASYGIVIDAKEEWEDWVILILGPAVGTTIIGCQPI